jgi:hypothetical protein
MANGASPLAAPFSQLKQLGTQGVQSVNSLNLNLAQALNQGLDVLSQGLPALPTPGGQSLSLPQLPGLPGGQSAPGAGPAGLLPSQLTQALSNVNPLNFLGALGKAPNPAPANQPAAPAAVAPTKVTQFRGM